jgi:hypothetical protein
MFDYTPMKKNAMSDGEVLAGNLIAGALAMIFWVFFAVSSHIFFMFAIIANAVQFLFVLESHHRKKLAKGK